MRLTVLALTACLCVAADWPQWRGPNRDGVLPAASAPKAWPDQLERRWSIEIGEGHSSPLLGGGRIYAFARLRGEEIVYGVDPGPGKVVWRQAYAAPYSMNPAATRHGEGPKSTPVFHAGRLYTFGISGILSAWDAASGRLLWRKDFSKSPLYGTAMSPMIDESRLIAHVGGHDDGALTAFDAATGEVRWSWKGDGPAYSSPIVATLAGVRQIVTHSQQNLVGVSAQTGELLWKSPFTTAYVQNIVTPLVYADTIIYSGLGNGTAAVRVAKQGNQWSAERVWHTAEVSMYMNSPVLAGDLLFGFSHRNRGQYFCLDPRSGKTLWLGEPRSGDNAAMVLAGGHLFLLNNEAALVIARPSAKAFEVMRKYTVASSPTWAHPLLLDNGVVIKDLKSLALWTW